MTMQEAVIKNIDTDYSYQLAKRMEQFRSNEKLGYRPAGSKAEFLTGEMLLFFYVFFSPRERNNIKNADFRKDD